MSIGREPLPAIVIRDATFIYIWFIASITFISININSFIALHSVSSSYQAIQPNQHTFTSTNYS